MVRVLSLALGMLLWALLPDTAQATHDRFDTTGGPPPLQGIARLKLTGAEVVTFCNELLAYGLRVEQARRRGALEGEARRALATAQVDSARLPYWRWVLDEVYQRGLGLTHPQVQTDTRALAYIEAHCYIHFGY